MTPSTTTEQYVIMLNDYPQEVCPPGTTENQAAARSVVIKEEYLKKNSPTNPHAIYVRSYLVDVTPPTAIAKGEKE